MTPGSGADLEAYRPDDSHQRGDLLPITHGEGTTKFLCEADACGKPVVAIDWPGCGQSVRSGVTGLPCPPNDVM